MITIFEGSQQSWKYPTNGTKVFVGVTVGVTVLVGVWVDVGVGGGDGQTPPIQKSPITTKTIGSLTAGSLPQKLSEVSGEILVSTYSPLQSIYEIECSTVSVLVKLIQLQSTVIVGVNVGVNVGVGLGMGHGQTCKQGHPSESINLTTTSVAPLSCDGILNVYDGGILTFVAIGTHIDNVISQTSIS